MISHAFLADSFGRDFCTKKLDERGRVVTCCAPLRDHSLPNTAQSAAPTRLVIVESPYAGDVDRNLRYLRACMRDCLLRGEAPFASHAIYTQPGVLCDELETERALGITAGLLWAAKADATTVYTDLGVSAGMRFGILDAEAHGRPIEHRRLPPARLAEVERGA